MFYSGDDIEIATDEVTNILEDHLTDVINSKHRKAFEVNTEVMRGTPVFTVFTHKIHDLNIETMRGYRLRFDAIIHTTLSGNTDFLNKCGVWAERIRSDHPNGIRFREGKIVIIAIEIGTFIDFIVIHTDKLKGVSLIEHAVSEMLDRKTPIHEHIGELIKKEIATSSAERFDDIRNYYQISATLHTAGQPLEDEFKLVRDAGIEVVINLARPDSPDALEDETATVRDNGMRYIPIPVDFEKPEKAELETFFAVMEECKAKNTLVHCAYNWRVATFVYLYRVLKAGDAEEKARRDMLYIWRPDEIWQQFIHECLEAYRDQ